MTRNDRLRGFGGWQLDPLAPLPGRCGDLWTLTRGRPGVILRLVDRQLQ